MLQKNYFVKICGNKDYNSSLMVASYTPDLMGWIFAPSSPRLISKEDASLQIKEIKNKYPKIKHVAVFAGNSYYQIMDIFFSHLFNYLQIVGPYPLLKKVYSHTRKTKTNLIPAIRVKEKLDNKKLLNYKNPPFFILDAFVAGQLGGTGKLLNLSLIQEIKQAHMIAGGVGIDNVEKILLASNAFGVDLSSSLEKNIPGQKEEKKLFEFMNKMKQLLPHKKIIRP